MAYKLSMLLSLFFMIQVFLFQGDLCFVEAIHNELDAVSLTVSYQISMNGRITDEIREFVTVQAKANIYCENEDVPFGEAITFWISREYRPFVISKDPMVISVKRSAVIGYFL